MTTKVGIMDYSYLRNNKAINSSGMKKLLILCAILSTVGMSSCTSQNEPDNSETNIDGLLVGRFSVREDKQVQFSQGNLQYQASTKIWRFAENQYDFVGNDNANISNDYSGWIDLFAWGTGRNPTLSSTERTDYVVYDEWGNNAISNGGNRTKWWKTLDMFEWKYLFYYRPNADELFGLGSVNGVNGTIILPDDWVKPEGVTFNPSRKKGLADDEENKDIIYNSNEDNYTHNTYTAAQWKLMESAGAVFLPAAGCRYGIYMDFVGTGGSYWSMTAGGDYKSYYFSYNIFGLSTQSYYDRCIGRSVRLVR